MGFSAIKGKAATYSPLQIIDMALAVEMTQLGLPPERTALVLVMNRWPTLMAIQLAARALAAKPEGFDAEAEQVDDPLSMFIYFDPAALNSLTLHLPAKILPDLDQASNSFFYGGVGIIKENIHKWTTGPVCRISMINITSMIHIVTASPFERGSPDAIAYRLHFFRQLENEAYRNQVEWEGADQAEAEYVHGLLEREEISDAQELSARLNVSSGKAARYIQEALQEKLRRADDGHS